MSSKPQSSGSESDFYSELGRELLKAILITTVTVLVRTLSDVLTPSQYHHDEHY